MRCSVLKVSYPGKANKGLYLICFAGMLCKGHMIITYCNASLFILPKMSVDSSSLFCLFVSFSLFPSSFLSLLSAKPKKNKGEEKIKKMIYLCLYCTFSHCSSISGVWKNCLWWLQLLHNLPCHWMHTLLSYSVSWTFTWNKIPFWNVI